MSRVLSLARRAWIAAALPAALQAQNAIDLTEEGEMEEVIVQSRAIGSVTSDIPPELTLDPADIQSYGVASVEELLSELAPQTGQSDSGQPVTLLNGRRIANFREIRDLPTEAILRTEVLPEEVALDYGFSADQKVVNIVLKPVYRTMTGEFEAETTTDGGGTRGEGEVALVNIQGDTRLNLEVDYERGARLLESDRNLISRAAGELYDYAGNITGLDDGEIDPALSALAGVPVTLAGVPASAASGAPLLADFLAGANEAHVTDTTPYRTLSPASDAVEINAVFARPLGNVSASVNASYEAENSQSLRGLPGLDLTLPAGNPFSPFADDVMLYRYPQGLSPLTQRSKDESSQLSATLNGALFSQWVWTLIGGYERGVSHTTTMTGIDVSSLQAALDAGDPALNPFAVLPADLLVTPLRDTAHSVSSAGDIELILNGRMGRLPAGPINTTFRLGGTITDFSSDSLRNNVPDGVDLSRQQADTRLNINLPILSNVSPIGALSANFNAGATPTSGFGTPLAYGYGLNWRPRQGLSVIASVANTDVAPSMLQLGNPQVVTNNVRMLDYRTGDTVDITRITGGNPDLLASERNITRVSLNWKPMQETDLTLQANYQRTSIRNSVESLPTASAIIEAAFPDRFERDAVGRLISINTTPVNFSRAVREQLRWGLNFSHRLESGQQEQGENSDARGGAQGGRLQFALYHTAMFRNELMIRPGIPVLDLLSGDGMSSVTGGGGGGGGGAGGPSQSRHRLEGQGGYFSNGLGLRLNVNWRSSTRINGGAGSRGDLHFADMATMSLRAFADLGQVPSLTQHSWMQGMRVTLTVNNLLNQRQHVYDDTGATPIAYQGAYLDPQGRIVRLTVRKLFF
ncbi:MAG: hypothetical protein LBE59_02350 [Nevskiaceae bacterium]|jgi:hypothetical protein|nr:hypothetical protein [Nevskiaceae bacterium]